MYRVTKQDGTVLTVDMPNWVKKDMRFDSFKCCGEADAECILLQEGETSNHYNIRVTKYPEYGTVAIAKV